MLPWTIVATSTHACMNSCEPTWSKHPGRNLSGTLVAYARAPSGNRIPTTIARRYVSNDAESVDDARNHPCANSAGTNHAVAAVARKRFSVFGFFLNTNRTFRAVTSVAKTQYGRVEIDDDPKTIAAVGNAYDPTHRTMHA